LLCLPAAPVLLVYDENENLGTFSLFEAASGKLLLASKSLLGDAGGKPQAQL
jgi:hypothetical protein